MDSMIFLIFILLIPLAAQIFVSSTYKKYKGQQNSKNITGFDVARKILDQNGLSDMYIVLTKGVMSDHYDSNRKTIRLSNEVYNGTSIASLSIAAHESGHALQDKEGYSFMRLRSFLFPIINLGTKLAYIILIVGLFLEIIDLLWVSVAMVSLGLIFQLVTLPVEFNASTRAKYEINKLNLAQGEELEDVSSMLKAAAFTYVAGVLASALQLVRLLSFANNKN